MRQISKKTNSEIITNKYQYPNDSGLIREILDSEQDFFCAYTEEYLTPGFARDVEHFNPTLKNTAADNYNNWFSASSRINRRKGSKPRWKRHQPILHPCSNDLEKRLIYKDGFYIPANIGDAEVLNLRSFLFLNDFGLPNARIAYIKGLKYLLAEFKNDSSKLKTFLLKDKSIIKYRTAIKTELGLDL